MLALKINIAIHAKTLKISIRLSAKNPNAYLLSSALNTW
jgi:hypothetical protein